MRSFIFWTVFEREFRDQVRPGTQIENRSHESHLWGVWGVKTCPARIRRLCEWATSYLSQEKLALNLKGPKCTDRRKNCRVWWRIGRVMPSLNPWSGGSWFGSDILDLLESISDASNMEGIETDAPGFAEKAKYYMVSRKACLIL